MKNLIIPILLLIAMLAWADAGTLPSHPQWILFSVGGQSIAYIDSRSIHRVYYYPVFQGVKSEVPTVTSASAWILDNNASWQPDGSAFIYDVVTHSWKKWPLPKPPVFFLSTLSKVEFDCEHNRERVVRVIFFSGHMGTGKVVSSEESSGSGNEWFSDDVRLEYNHVVTGIACRGFPYGYLKQQSH